MSTIAMTEKGQNLNSVITEGEDKTREENGPERIPSVRFHPHTHGHGHGHGHSHGHGRTWRRHRSFKKATSSLARFLKRRLGRAVLVLQSPRTKKMASSITCKLLFNALLPLSLLAACIFRYNFFSFLYFTCLLVLPLLPSPTKESMQGHTGRFLKTIVILTSIIVGAQVTFQVVLLALQPYGHWLEYCSTLEKALRQIGFQRLDIPVVDAIRAVAPDVSMCIISIIVYAVCYKLTKNERSRSETGTTVHRRTTQRTVAMDLLWSFTTCFLTALAGIILPSVTSSVYFITFLIVVSWWSCYNSWGRKLVYVRIVMLTYCGAHLVALYLYQFQFFQTALHPDSLYARLFGLTAIITYDKTCAEPYILHVNTALEWPVYVNPIILFVYYWYLALLTCQWIQNPHMLEVTHKTRHRRRRRHSSGERELLVDDRSKERIPKYHSMASASADQGDSPTEGEAVISRSASPPPTSSGEYSSNVGSGTEQQLEFHGHVRKPWMSILLFIMRQSYTVSLIVMMAWSITYHSWLTFVLLLWACFIWMIPSSRAACLYSSPFLVIYAECLLIIGYVYGLNLSDSELPTEGTVNYKDIGLVKHEFPCVHIAVKILYTSIFWLTLRQYARERLLKKQQVSDETIGLQPFGLIFSTEHHTAPDAETPRDLQDGADSETVRKIGKMVQSFLSKYWIVLCGAMFLIVSLQEQVVVYRIVYMGLWLFYMIVLVISYKAWRIIMLTYWWIVVFYSMCVLVIIYTYQFENFPAYWQNGTGLAESTLEDIGLQQYGTSGLLVGLLTPTIFVIIIVVQLHYYHIPFLTLSAIAESSYRRTRGSVEKDDVTEEDQGRAAEGESSEVVPVRDNFDEPDNKSTDTLAHKTPKEILTDFCKALKRWYTIITFIIWRVLEMHMIKAIFFTTIVVCVTQVSALNFVFIFFLFFAIPIPWLQGVFCVCAMCWASLIILAKMTYQLNSVNATLFDMECDSFGEGGLPVFVANTTFNLAEWVGFQKHNSIFNYTAGYIALVSVIILQTIVNLHQKQYRWENNLDTPKRGILFDDITRQNADDGLLHMTKYLINYFFYKFGLEMCYAMTVVTICVRLDVYSVIYATWLGILMLLLRRITYLVWPVYMCFLSIVFPILYLVCLGLPSGLCIAYPWGNFLDPNLIRWLYLPNYIDPPDAKKMVADFFQLLFVSLQWQVFRVETKIQDQYGGGDNDMVDKEGPVEQNPVPNFMNNKSYLDLLKNVCFNYTLWVVLAMVFLAGTSLVSIFCLGYLGLCFFFMWFGQDYLLKPRKTLLKAWNVMMMYNVAVIFIKACLQVVACVYIQSFYSNFCWLIQLLSLVCLQQNYSDDVYSSDQCEVPTDQAGMSWDGVLFVFLLIQKRIFTCHYFQYVVEDVKEQHTLAAKGAILIIQQLADQVRDRKGKEDETLTKIRDKIEKVKARQAKLKGKDKGEPRDHWEEARHYFIGSRKRETIRGGDRFLWEDETDDESDTESAEEGEKTPRKAGPIQLAYSALTEGSKETIKKDRAIRRSISQTDGALLERRRSRLMSWTSEEQDAYIVDEDIPIFTDQPLYISPGPSSPKSPISPKSLPTPPVSPTPEDETDGAAASKPKADPAEVILEEEEPKDGEEVAAEGEGEEGQEDKPKKEDTLWDKFCNTVTIGWLIFLRAMDAVTDWIFTISENYRFVATQLKHFKADIRGQKILQRASIDDGTRPHLSLEDETRGADDKPGTSKDDKEKSQEIVPLATEDDEGSQQTTGDVIVATTEPKLAFIPPIQPPQSGEDFEYVGDDLTDDIAGGQSERQKLSRPVRLLFALLYALISQSQTVCYLLMILSQIVEASLLSLPYPISVFLWAMLTVPRPTKRYWICAISYTEIVVLVKFFFQFGFWPWISDANDIDVIDDPFWWPRVIGIDKRDNYAVYDLAILLALFFHRSVLKSHGLWKDGSRDDTDSDKQTPSKDDETSSKAGEIEDTPTTQSDAITDTPEGKELAVVTDQDGQGIARQKQDPDEISERDEDITTMTEEEMDEAIQESWIGPIIKPFKEFYEQMTDDTYSAVTDVYVLMFLCDLICFLITVFAWWAFGQNARQDNVTVFLEQNKLPLASVMLWLVQFALIVIDRGLYLRKNVVGKFVFLVVLVVAVHVWLFFLLPYITKQAFINNTPAQFWYFIKCIYFGLSAYQISSGYPTRILGNFLTKKYNYINLFLFKGFCLIPFLLELRILMDWTWTDTTLSLSHWMKIEDIYNNVYEIKCWRKGEKDYPTPRGQKKGKVSKYTVGLLLLVLLILIIWFPLIYFSLIIDSTSVANPSYDCTVQIQIDGYENLYEMSAQQGDFDRITSARYNEEFGKYKDNLAIQSFLRTYNLGDIYEAKMDGFSTSLWTISPPSRQALIEDLNDTSTLRNMKFYLSFSRIPQNSLVHETVKYQNIYELDYEDPKKSAIREQLIDILQSNMTAEPVEIVKFFPRYVIVPPSGEVIPATMLLPEERDQPHLSYSNMSLQLSFDPDEQVMEWWRVKETYSDPEKESQDYLTIIAFNERVSTDALSFLTSYGIIGLYVSLVLVVGRFVRMFVSGISYKIMFEELPNPDRILRLCLDIFMVRESNEFILEEELTAKLIFLYRSPETLIQVTKIKYQ
ncbi:piezo-type mechanosensitive ion channel component 2-like [Glandiceps talaboti]